MAGYVETGAAEREMTAVEYAALPESVRTEIYYYIKTHFLAPHIRNTCLSNASALGIHAALGPIHELSLRTLFIRTGLQLGFSRTWDAAALASAVNRRTVPRAAR